MEKSNLRDLYNSSPNQKAKLIRGVIYSFLNKVFDLAPPVLIGIAIDIVVEGEESFIAQLGYVDKKQQLIVLAFLTFFIWTLESIFDYVAALTWRNISQDIEHELRMETYANTQTLDLSYFENIIPCGIVDKKVTSLKKEMGRPIEMEEVKEKLKFHLTHLFEMKII